MCDETSLTRIKTRYAAIIYVRADGADVPKLVCTTVTLL
jgi:hypothetical protein